jgi:hypothetical protein
MKSFSTKKIAVLFLGLCLAAFSASGYAGNADLSKEEIIQRAWKAMFGDLKKENVDSLYVEKFSPGGKVPKRMTVKRPNLFRNEVVSGILVFDGKRAAWAKQEPDEKGKPRGPELIKPDAWKHFEVDIALLIPAFFDYPSEYQGREKVDGALTYKIFVQLPKGGQMTYFVDAATFQVKKRLVNSNGVAGENQEDLMGPYLKYDKVLFPDGYSYRTETGTAKAEYKNVRININPPAELFKIPKELIK